MNEHDVIRHMGRFPEKIIPTGGIRMMSKNWKCSKCNEVYESEEPVKSTCPV
jgi:hypothetical protein